MNEPVEDVVLWALASPILAAKAMARAARRAAFWRVSYTPNIACRNCAAVISLVGLWRCGCGYTYRGHLLRECPVCGSWPAMVRCAACGLTETLPRP